MELKEAIQRCKQISEQSDNEQCRSDYNQLAQWLSEFKELRSPWKDKSVKPKDNSIILCACWFEDENENNYSPCLYQADTDTIIYLNKKSRHCRFNECNAWMYIPEINRDKLETF